MADNKEYISQPVEMGSINISEDVVATIAAAAAAEVEGVSGLAANIGSDLAELLGKKNLSRGIKLQITENTVSIDVHVLVKYGQIIPTIAKSIQDAVMSSVEAMTGLTVSGVNVHVGGVTFDKEKRSGD
ncbi:Asp23/Gls24 family envelope stress response protein [Papillibacter cinnamivorans]|uniref:Uncharacterized conserved protein YloU, alkaline shock protein (Asp23) family n=1 Tax=Papillibacter cinnamivorans DSM 12816 TaxID=1122930 RepID=A0A1W2CK12_9FIRM|nr:Asp23/Gls24 family envelope stress response protein [Papillibacter cinnamivorans]SMC85530.1 Uncharacterized conserved protein YloU, alkaline shock protein (Asp23) family [Papillibacter cinnamivorans DSM 12816]